MHASRGDVAVLDTYAHLRPLWDTDGLFLILTGAALIDLHGDRGDLKAALAAHDHDVDTVSRTVGEHVLPGPGPAQRADDRSARDGCGRTRRPTSARR